MNSPFTIQCIHDIAEAQKYRELLNPDLHYGDLRELRYIFFKHFWYEAYFYVGFVDQQPIGLLPLQYNTSHNSSEKYVVTSQDFLEFFGGWWFENNKIFIKPWYESYIPEFMQALKLPAYLQRITTEHPYIHSLPIGEHQYILDVSKRTSYNDFLDERFEGKTKATFKKQMKKIEEENTIEIIINHKEDLETMVDRNIERFGSDSSFTRPHRQAIFRDMVQSDRLETYVLTFMVNRNKEWVSLAIKHKDTYAYLNAWSTFNTNNLGKYIIMANIDMSIKLWCKTFDAMRGDGSRKEKWHLTAIPEYNFKNFEPDDESNTKMKGAQKED